MLLHESRRAARTSPTGELILLDDQDRSLWNREQIAEGIGAGASGRSRRGAFGPYTLQAAIAAVHAEAPSRRRDGLGADRRALRRAAARRAVAGGRAEPRRGGGDARRPGGGSGAHRRHPRARRSGGLPPRPRGARGPVPAARPRRRGPRRPTSARSPSPGRSRSGGFSSGGCANSRTDAVCTLTSRAEKFVWLGEFDVDSAPAHTTTRYPSAF